MSTRHLLEGVSPSVVGADVDISNTCPPDPPRKSLARFDSAWTARICRVGAGLTCPLGIVEERPLTSRRDEVEETLSNEMLVDGDCSRRPCFDGPRVRRKPQSMHTITFDDIHASQLGDFSSPSACIGAEPRHPTACSGKGAAGVCDRQRGLEELQA